MLLCAALLLRVNRGILFAVGAVFIILFILMALGEIFPIDTTTNPVDISTLRIESSGQKVIVRTCVNAKSNRTIYDTVRIKDYFILRRIVSK